jgi:ADP-ribose pyrophosphatase YjhB (NUDIX family)
MTHKISVSAILCYKDQLVMIKESQHGVVSWDIPAGGVDANENLDHAIIREVMEESGVAIQNPKLIRIFNFIETEKTTINFLYFFQLENYSDEFVMENKVYGEEILSIKLFDKEQVKNIIDNKKYEHKLAKARLEVFLSSQFDEDLHPVFI